MGSRDMLQHLCWLRLTTTREMGYLLSLPTYSPLPRISALSLLPASAHLYIFTTTLVLRLPAVLLCTSGWWKFTTSFLRIYAAYLPASTITYYTCTTYHLFLYSACTSSGYCTRVRSAPVR